MIGDPCTHPAGLRRDHDPRGEAPVRHGLMMDCMRGPPPVCLQHRVRAPIEPSAALLRDAFFDGVGDLTLGLVSGEKWRLRLGPITLLAFRRPAFGAAAREGPTRAGAPGPQA